jgi:hypothetical protein
MELFEQENEFSDCMKGSEVYSASNGNEYWEHYKKNVSGE